MAEFGMPEPSLSDGGRKLSKHRKPYGQDERYGTIVGDRSG